MPEDVRPLRGWGRFVRSVVAPLVAGALLVPAFAPFDWWPLAAISLALLLGLWAGCRPRTAAARGFLFGVGCFGPGIYWLYISVHTFGGAPVWLAVALTVALIGYMSLYPAAAGWLLCRLFPGAGAVRSLLAFPALWALLEWLRSWLFTGFPWLSVGYSQIDTPLAGYAPVLGVFGVGMALALSAGCLWLLLSGPPRRRLLALGAAAAVWAGGALLGGVPWTHPDGRALTVALVQGNEPQNKKWLPDNLMPTLQRYLRLTDGHWNDDLIIWPEAAIPALYDNVSGFIDALGHKVASHHSHLMLGVLRHMQRGNRYFNSVLDIGPHGGRHFYYKRHLVPFGEYFPVPDFVRQWLRILHLPYTSLSPGRPDQPPLPVDGVPAGVSICYEDAFGSLIVRDVPPARILVNVSNDAWFGHSIALAQHLEMTRMRALEAGRPLLRTTNTGITALIGYRGRIRASLPKFHAAVLTGRVQPRRGATPYAIGANKWLVALAGAGLFLALLLAPRLSRRDPR
ncbi:MAG TPA: apolipoprotein N-acyltransferase [Gammaproteobacteria bacterium]|nr:apolipoprotein N-acyltransferase [Gammaproteobacteria bacterium]